MHISTSLGMSVRWTRHSRDVHEPDDAFSLVRGIHAVAMDAEGIADVFPRSLIAVFVFTAIINCQLPSCSQPPACILAGCRHTAE
jgi:hypothetical protein